MNVIPFERVNQLGGELLSLKYTKGLTCSNNVFGNVIKSKIKEDIEFDKLMKELETEEFFVEYKLFYEEFIDIISAFAGVSIILKQADIDHYKKAVKTISNVLTKEKDYNDDVLERSLSACLKLLNI